MVWAGLVGWVGSGWLIVVFQSSLGCFNFKGFGSKVWFVVLGLQAGLVGWELDGFGWFLGFLVG